MLHIDWNIDKNFQPSILIRSNKSHFAQPFLSDRRLAFVSTCLDPDIQGWDNKQLIEFKSFC